MSECYSRVFIENGIVRNKSEFDLAKVFEDDVIYEVIRVRDRMPVFFADHFDRLVNSTKMSGNKPVPDYHELREQVLTLIGICGIAEGNLKIILKFTSSFTGYLVYFIEAQYPGPDMYKKGVEGILYYAERRNPVAKVFNHKLRSAIYAKLIQAGAYEALLVNRDSCITEGSRSNIFFIKGDRIITAPDDMVLGGITRKKILEICSDEGMAIGLRCIHTDELKHMDCVFMSGTSPIALPFKSIGGHTFNTDNRMLTLIGERYMERIDSYLKEFGKETDRNN